MAKRSRAPKRRHGKPAQYLLRGIPRDTWIAVRRRASEEGRTIKWVLLQLLELYVNHETKSLL